MYFVAITVNLTIQYNTMQICIAPLVASESEALKANRVKLMEISQFIERHALSFMFCSLSLSL